MCAVQKELVIPLTDTGRKCGYITWRKKDDADVKSIFGNSSYVNLVFDNSKFVPVNEKVSDFIVIDAAAASNENKLVALP